MTEVLDYHGDTIGQANAGRPDVLPSRHEHLWDYGGAAGAGPEATCRRCSSLRTISRISEPPRRVVYPRRPVQTASSGTGAWEELLARVLAAVPPCRAVPGASVCHLRVDDQVALVAEHDLSGPLYDLVTAVLAIGEAPH